MAERSMRVMGAIERWLPPCITIIIIEYNQCYLCEQVRKLLMQQRVLNVSFPTPMSSERLNVHIPSEINKVSLTYSYAYEPCGPQDVDYTDVYDVDLSQLICIIAHRRNLSELMAGNELNLSDDSSHETLEQFFDLDKKDLFGVQLRFSLLHDASDDWNLR